MRVPVALEGKTDRQRGPRPVGKFGSLEWAVASSRRYGSVARDAFSAMLLAFLCASVPVSADTTLPTADDTSTQLLPMQGAKPTERMLLFSTGKSARWRISAANDPEGGNNVGSPLEIDAYGDSGRFTGLLARATRASGPLGGGKPAFTSLAPWSQTFTRATRPGSAVGNDSEFGNAADDQPVAKLGTDPLSVTAGSPTVMVTWPGCCGAGGPVSKSIETWINLLGATETGGITPTGWILVQSVVDSNTFTLAWTSKATKTTSGGGASVTVQPSWYTITNKVWSTVKTGSSGFTVQTVELFVADPYFLQPRTNRGSPKYLQRWSQTVGPNDTSGTNNWSIAGWEWDFLNRGADGGYSPDIYGAMNPTVGLWLGPWSVVSGYVTGGGKPANWNTIYGVFQQNGIVGTYDGLNIQPNALVGAARDPSGHGGVGVDVFGSYVGLVESPFTTTRGSAVVKVTVAPSRLAVQDNGGLVWIPNVVTVHNLTFGGAVYTMSGVGSPRGAFTFTVPGGRAADTSGSGGGTGQWLAFSNLVPYAPYQIWGSFKHGLISTNARFESGGIIETAAGNNVIWSGATGTASIGAADRGAGNIDIVATVAGAGTFDISGTAATTASTPAKFSANHYVPMKVNGITYYLPLATAPW